jgi:hypothetical protein
MNNKNENLNLKARTITLNLTDDVIERLAVKTAENNITITELIENFVNDLIGGEYSNGSDERDLANQYFNRLDFQFFKKSTLLAYLLEDLLFSNVKEFIGDFFTYFVDLDDDEKDLYYVTDDYEELLNKFIEENPEADVDKEIENVRKWLTEYEEICGAEMDEE